LKPFTGYFLTIALRISLPIFLIPEAIEAVAFVYVPNSSSGDKPIVFLLQII